MADTITARGTDSKFQAHPEGQFVAQCVDVIDLGEKLSDFPGSPSYLAPVCALVFRSGEINEQTGEPIDIAREFTVSMGEKANLRKFLEQWRGKPYTADEAKQGVPLDKLEGRHGLLTVAHRTSGKGRIYANITACVGIPKQMKESVTDYRDGYERAPYWETKKAEYAAAAQKFRSDNAAPKQDFDDFPAGAVDDDDELPF